MNLLSLYHFFAGKASDKQKEAIKRWAESSPDNYETLCREKKIFDAGDVYKRQDISYPEIAKKLFVNQKTVEYHISKALKALRAVLKDYLSFWIYLI